jgi:uncharacterized protein YjbI with pentapeptide repeats
MKCQIPGQNFTGQNFTGHNVTGQNFTGQNFTIFKTLLTLYSFNLIYKPLF